jgi:hypothetical protein
MRLIVIALFCGTALAQPTKQAETAPAQEPPLSGSVDIGYRSLLTRAGSLDAFRSVVNLGAGPKLFGSEARFAQPGSKLFDEASLTLRNWGGEPNSTLHGDVRKSNRYHLDVEYRDFAHFNFLPSFANPLINTGSRLNQSAIDTRLRAASARLELAPSSRVSPFLSYSRNTERGRGVWLFSAQGNEYAVPALHNFEGNAYSGGVTLSFGKWTATLEQGASEYREDQSTGEAVLNPGNLQRPYLGRTLSLGRLTEQYRVRGDALFSRALVAAALARWLDLHAAFTFSNPDTAITYDNAASGVFVTPGTLLDAGGGTARLTGTANALRPSGSFRTEIRPARRWRIVQAFRTDRFENSASAQLLERYLTAGAPTQFSTSPADRLRVDDNRQELDAFTNLTKDLTLRAGYRYNWGNASFRPSSFQTGPLAAGRLDRHSGVAGLQYRKGPTRFSADFERGVAGQVYFRNSLRDYSKVRARASYALAAAWRASFDYQWLKNYGSSSGVAIGSWDFESSAASASLEWMPKKAKSVSLFTSYARSTAESNINIFEPRTLMRERSAFREAGHSGSLFFRLAPGARTTFRPGLTAGGSFHVNGGSRPTRYYLPQARLALPFYRNVGAYAEWRWYGFSQPLYPFENFTSHQMAVGLTISR